MKVAFFSKRMTVAWVAALVIGLLAATTPWLDPLRPTLLGERFTSQFFVTSGEDSGIGSLREAIFEADRVDGRVRLRIDAPTITLTSPLPPVINPVGIVIDTTREGVQIDASRVPAAPVLDIASPNAVISGVGIAGARGQAILLRTDGARLSRLRIQQSAVGVFVVDDVSDLRIDDSQFDRNGIGIQLGSRDAGVQILRNRFRGHAKAAIWSVAPTASRTTGSMAIGITGNAFDGDETSIVLINGAARVDQNTFIRPRTAGVLVRASAVTVRGNRLHSSLGFGISAAELDHAVIADNEINHNCGGGILIRETQGAQILSNRLYSNGYGIVMVLGTSESPNNIVGNTVMRSAVDGLYVIGASPLIRRNRLLENEKTGLHLSSLQARGQAVIESRPFVEANVFYGNGADAPVADAFRVGTGESPAVLEDCAWRGTSADEPGALVQ
jgi:hypothetical protein